VADRYRLSTSNQSAVSLCATNFCHLFASYGNLAHPLLQLE